MNKNSIPFFPEQASAIASNVDALYAFLVLVTAFFSLLIAVLIVYFAIKYRRRSEDYIPGPVHGGIILELVWSVIPLGLSMVMFAWGASIFFTESRPPADSMEIYVTGKQWMWKLQHMEGQREMNELHVPVNRDIKLTMTSEDVIHDFLRTGFSLQVRRSSWENTRRSGSDPTKVGDLPHLLRGILRHAALEHDRYRVRHGTRREFADCGWLERQAAKAAWLCVASQLVPTTGLLATATRQDGQGRCPNPDRCLRQTASTDKCRCRGDCGRRSYVRESILNPERENCGRVTRTSCQRIPGLGNRRRTAAAD